MLRSISLFLSTPNSYDRISLTYLFYTMHLKLIKTGIQLPLFCSNLYDNKIWRLVLNSFSFIFLMAVYYYDFFNLFEEIKIKNKLYYIMQWCMKTWSKLVVIFKSTMTLTFEKSNIVGRMFITNSSNNNILKLYNDFAFNPAVLT